MKTKNIRTVHEKESGFRWVYLRERSVVPDVPVMREAIVHETQLPLLLVLLDRIQFILRRYLEIDQNIFALK